MPILGVIASSISGNLTKPYWATATTSGTADYANRVATDSSGNVYVVGVYQNKGMLISFDKFGAFRWGKTIVIGSHTFDSLSAVRVGADGFVYASGGGYPGGGGGFTDAAILLKYSTAGVQQWNVVYTNPYASFSDFNFDSSGNIYVVGQYTNNTTNGFGLLKYNSSGVYQSGIYNTTPLGNISSNGVTVANNGDIYVVGRSDSTSVGNGGVGNKGLFAKFNSSLVNQFFKSIDNGSSSGRYNALWNATQVNGADDIYVTCAQSTSNSGSGVMSFNTFGTVQWSRSIIDTTSGGGNTAIATDGTGVYTSGYTAAGNPLYWVKFDLNGATLLSRKWSQASNNMYGVGLALGGTTEVAVSGFSYFGSDTRPFISQIPRDGTKTGTTVNINGLNFVYGTGTATISSYSPSVADVSASFSSLGSGSSQSVTEATITPTFDLEVV